MYREAIVVSRGCIMHMKILQATALGVATIFVLMVAVSASVCLKSYYYLKR